MLSLSDRWNLKNKVGKRGKRKKEEERGGAKKRGGIFGKKKEGLGKSGGTRTLWARIGIEKFLFNLSFQKKIKLTLPKLNLTLPFN